MLTLALLAMQVPPPGISAPVDPAADEIVVIGRKLKTWRGSVRSNRRGTSCRTRTSSGDPQIDAIGCAAMLHCWPATLPRFQASTAKGIAPADRKRLQTDANAALVSCLTIEHRTRVEALADRRAGAS